MINNFEIHGFNQYFYSKIVKIKFINALITIFIDMLYDKYCVEFC